MSISNSKKFLTRRYILFFISVFINAYGICFITKAMLGTSPITSVNYVLSMFTPLTMGQWTIIVNLLFMVFELFFMTRDQLKSDLRVFLLQIPITLCFGTFIDISMASLSWLNPVGYGTQAGRGLSDDDVLFVAESKTVKEIADREACVIVGRCADFVLDGRANVVRVFCCSDERDAVKRCADEYGLDRDKAQSEIRRVNRARANHYEYYTGRRWGDPHNYDITVNTARLGLDTACGMIMKMIGQIAIK